MSDFVNRAADRLGKALAARSVTVVPIPGEALTRLESVLDRPFPEPWRRVLARCGGPQGLPWPVTGLSFAPADAIKVQLETNGKQVPVASGRAVIGCVEGGGVCLTMERRGDDPPVYLRDRASGEERWLGSLTGLLGGISLCLEGGGPVRTRFVIGYPSATPTPHLVLPPLEDAVRGDLEVLRTRFLPLFAIELSAVNPSWSGLWYALYHEHQDGEIEFSREPSGRLSPVEPVAEDLEELQSDIDEVAAAVKEKLPHPWIALVHAEVEVPPWVDSSEDLPGHWAWREAWRAAVREAALRLTGVDYRRGVPILLLGNPASVQVVGASWVGKFLSQISGSNFGLVDWEFYWGFKPGVNGQPDRMSVDTESS